MKKKPSAFFLFIAIIVLTLGLGWGIEKAFGQNLTPTLDSVLENTMDPVPERYQTGLSLYLENCSTCHIPIPPQVLPTQTWQRILEKPQSHYGSSLPPMISSFQMMMWDYLRTFSRPSLIDESSVFYIQDSRYFKALHPQVELPLSISSQTCLTCHSQARNFNYHTIETANDS